MSALESLLRSRRTRRFPWDESLPSGAPAIDVLMPRRTMEARTGELDPAVAPVPVETLEAPPALRPRRAFTPPEFGAVEESALPLTAPEGVDFQPEMLATRRRWSSPFNQEGERNAAIRDVLADPSQLPKASKWERWLLNPLQRAAEGIAATGSPAGGLGGLGAGFVESALNPRAVTQRQYQGQLAESDQRLGQLQAQADAGLKRRGAMANVLKTEAETLNLLNPKPKEPYRFKGDDGLQYQVDSATGEARPIPGQGRKAVGAKVLRTTVRGGKVWYETEEGLKPATDPDTGEQLSEPMREITLNGQKFSVPETKAAEIFGSIEAANTTAGNQYGNQSYEDTVRRMEREHGERVSLWESARQAQGALTKAVEELNQAVAQRDAAAKDEDRVAWEAEAKTRKQTVEKMAASVQQAYGDFVQNDAQNWPTILKPRPAAPAPPQRPAPQRRSVGTAPRQGGTVRNATPSSVLSIIDRVRNRR